MKKRTVVIAAATAVVLIMLILVFSAFYTVSEGYIAAVYTMGKLESLETRTGLHFILPGVQTASIIDIREQSVEVPQNAYTKDTQTVENLITKVNYFLDVSQMENIIRDIGVDMIYDKIILPNVLSITRNTVGQYTADALIGHRAELSQSIQDQLEIKLQAKGVTLTAFTIQNIDFEDSFEAAVRRKVEAEQSALEAQNKTREMEELGRQQVIQAQAEADATRAKAEAEAFAIEARADAEAHAIEVINKQIAGSADYIDYLRITQWDGRMPLVQGEGSSPILDLRGVTEGSNQGTSQPAPSNQSTQYNQE